jgi:hypothetical protein
MTPLNLKILLLFALSFLAHHTSISQRASRHFIDSILSIRDTTFKSTNQIMYVVNGVPYDTMKLESILDNYDIRLLLDAVYLNGQYPFYRDAAVIVFAYEQKAKSKRRVRRYAKKLFNDNSNPPVLLINNSIIDKTTSRVTFQEIRIRDILYIDRLQLGNENRIRIWTDTSLHLTMHLQ